jgi:hypothetical protein
VRKKRRDGLRKSPFSELWAAVLKVLPEPDDCDACYGCVIGVESEEVRRRTGFDLAVLARLWDQQWMPAYQALGTTELVR